MKDNFRMVLCRPMEHSVQIGVGRQKIPEGLSLHTLKNVTGNLLDVFESTKKKFNFCYEFRDQSASSRYYTKNKENTVIMNSRGNRSMYNRGNIKVCFVAHQ